MKINWKQLMIAYVIGILTMFIIGLTTAFLNNPISLLVISILCLSIPGFFYFNKNKCEFNDAIKISAIFGFTLMLIYFLILIIPLSIVYGLTIGSFPDFITISKEVNWGAMVFELIAYGIGFTIITVIAYWIDKHYLSKPKK